MISQSASGWLFCRPIRPLVVPLSTFLWLLLCGYRGVKYRFFIFNLLQKFLYTRLSNYGPLFVTIDWSILNMHTMFFHTNLTTLLSLMDVKASASINLLK